MCICVCVYVYVYVYVHVYVCVLRISISYNDAMCTYVSNLDLLYREHSIASTLYPIHYTTTQMIELAAFPCVEQTNHRSRCDNLRAVQLAQLYCEPSVIAGDIPRSSHLLPFLTRYYSATRLLSIYALCQSSEERVHEASLPYLGGHTNRPPISPLPRNRLVFAEQLCPLCTSS